MRVPRVSLVELLIWIFLLAVWFAVCQTLRTNAIPTIVTTLWIVGTLLTHRIVSASSAAVFALLFGVVLFTLISALIDVHSNPPPPADLGPALLAGILYGSFSGAAVWVITFASSKLVATISSCRCNRDHRMDQQAS